MKRMVISLALMGAVAACGGQAAPAASPAGSSPATAASAAVPAASTAASKPAAASGAPASAASSSAAPAAAGGLASASPAASASAAASNTAAGTASGPIKIGELLPLTGAFGSNVGNDNKDGFALYFQTLNNTIAGRQIQISTQDDQGLGEPTAVKSRELVENEKVSLLVGVEGTPEALTLAPYVKQVKVPVAITGNAGTANLLVDPKIASPYMNRFTVAVPQFSDTISDWAFKQGYRKAVLIVSDYAGGLQTGDAAAAAFVNRGGSIVQELYPAQGTKDFGPFLAKLDQSADVILEFLPGTDGLRFMQQFDDYVPQRKAVILDVNNVIARGPSVDQLKDKAVGMVASADWTEALDNPLNQDFLKLFAQKFPGRVTSADVAEGYAGAEAVASAIKAVNGNVENSDAFLNALHNVDVDTIKGHVKLDKTDDVIESMYIFQIVKNGNSYGRKVLDTYKDITPFWDMGATGTTFPFGTLKGKWVGMTKAQLAQITAK